jgi:hypothetical protein
MTEITECEAAFLAHFKSVCPGMRRFGGGNKGSSDACILDTWHEFVGDWVAAVRWGQAHPQVKDLRSERKRVIRKAAKFLAQGEAV